MEYTPNLKINIFILAHKIWTSLSSHRKCPTNFSKGGYWSTWSFLKNSQTAPHVVFIIISINIITTITNVTGQQCNAGYISAKFYLHDHAICGTQISLLGFILWQVAELCLTNIKYDQLLVRAQILSLCCYFMTWKCYTTKCICQSYTPIYQSFVISFVWEIFLYLGHRALSTSKGP